MSEFKGTPGPWFVQDDHGKRWIETDGSDDTICEVHRRKKEGSVYRCQEAGANAQLIAASPDLLSVVMRLTALEGEWHPDRYQNEKILLLKDARAALAKALGQ